MIDSHCKYAGKHYGKISDTALAERLSLGFAEGIEKISSKIKWEGREPAEFLGALYDYVYARILCIAPALLSSEGLGEVGRSAITEACVLAFECKSFEDLPIEPEETHADQIMVDVKHMKKEKYGDYSGISSLMEAVALGIASEREAAQLLCEYQTLFNRQKRKLFFRFFENRRRARLLNEIEKILFERYPETDLLSTDPNSILGRIPYKNTFIKLDELLSTVCERFADYLGFTEKVEEEPCEEAAEASVEEITEAAGIEVETEEVAEEVAEAVEAEEVAETEDSSADNTAEDDTSKDTLLTDEPIPTVDSERIISEASAAFMGAMSAMVGEADGSDDEEAEETDKI